MGSGFLDRILDLPDRTGLERIAVVQHVVDLQVLEIDFLEKSRQFLFNRLFAGHCVDRYSQVGRMLDDRAEREQVTLVLRDLRILSSAADDLSGGLVSETTAKAGRYSRGSADVRRQTEHRRSGSHQGRTATGRSAWNSAEIVRIVGPSSHVVVGVKPESNSSEIIG